MEKVLWFIKHAIELIYPKVCGVCDEICKDELCKKCEIQLKNIAKFKIDNIIIKSLGNIYIFLNTKE